MQDVISSRALASLGVRWNESYGQPNQVALPRFLFALATGFGTLAVSLPVRAEGVQTWLEIHRDGGSLLCPSEPSVFGAITRLFPVAPIRRSTDASQASASAVVSVRRTTQGGHEARIRVSRPRQGERMIVDQDPGCEGLADALAVALVMLIEPERAVNTAPSTTAPPNTAPSTANTSATSTPAIATPATAPPNDRGTSLAPTNAPGGPASPNASTNVASPQRELTAPRQTPKETAQPLRLGAFMSNTPAQDARTRVTSAGASSAFVRTSVGGFALGGFGLVSEPSAGAGVSLAMAWSSGLGLVLEGARLWALPAERAPGRVSMDLYAVLFSGCYSRPLSSPVTLGGCLVFGGGAQHATAHGFASNGSKTRPWLVLGPRFELGWRWNAWLEGFSSLSAVGHLRRYSFSVEQLEVVADAPWVGVMLNVGMRAELPFFAARPRTR